jgi:hypothetical protein
MGQIYKDVNQFYGENQALFGLVGLLIGLIAWNKAFHRLHFTLFRPVKNATQSMTALIVQLENAVLAIRKSSRLVLRLEAYSSGFFIVTLILLALAGILLFAPPPVPLFPQNRALVPLPPEWPLVDVPVILLFVVVVFLQIFRFKMLGDIEKCVIGDLRKPRLMLEKAKAVGVKYVDANPKQLAKLKKACTRVELLLKELEEIAEKVLPGEEIRSS